MEIVVHRVNTVNELKSIPYEFGVELDIRADRGRLIMHHDPHQPGEDFETYLDSYKHGLMVVNIKESGIENQAMEMLASRGIESYFLLDLEFPWIVQASLESKRKAALRFSEFEPIEAIVNFTDQIDWVWVDCFSKLPISYENLPLLAPFKLCMVCPERWGRPDDICRYIDQLKEVGRMPDAVMTALPYVKQWL